MTPNLPDLIRTRHGQYMTVFVDIEGECNLRCVYCYQSDKDFKPHKGMSESTLESALRFAQTFGRNSINVTAQGEFTHGKNWRAVAERLLAAGASVCCTSNLSRPLANDEINTLSRFSFICVSLDSADRETLRAIRRSADIRAIADNVLRIRAAAVTCSAKPPKMVVNCVLSTGNGHQLSALASYCFSLGIDAVVVSPIHAYGHFDFDKNQLGDARVDDPIDAWPLEKIKTLRNSISEAIAIAKRTGRAFSVAPALAQRLNARLLGQQSTSNVVPPGKTRRCLQPWDRVVINHDGTVMPCCYGADVVGTITDGNFEQVVNGEKMRSLKTALLTGEDLPQACRSCVGEAIASPEDQRATVARYLVATSR